MIDQQSLADPKAALRDRQVVAGCKHSTKRRERQQSLQPAHSLPSPH